MVTVADRGVITVGSELRTKTTARSNGWMMATAIAAASSSILIVAPNASSTACVTSSARASWSRTTRYATMMRSATAPKRAIRSTAAKVVRR